MATRRKKSRPADKMVKVSPTHYVDERGASWVTIKKRKSGWYVMLKKRRTHGPYKDEKTAKAIANGLRD